MTSLFPDLADMWFAQLIQRLGWTLLHSLWQGAALAAILALTLALLRHRSAQSRYLAGCLGLAMLVGLTAATYCLQPPLRKPSIAVRSGGVAASVQVAPTQSMVPTSHHPALPTQTFPAGQSTWIDTVPPISDSLANRLERWSTIFIEPMLPWLGGFWLAGMTVLALWQLAGWLYLRRLRRLAMPLDDPSLLQRVACLTDDLQVHHTVRVFESALVRVPAVIGWLRPVIFLPLGLMGEMSPRQIDAILAHELAHIRRYDYLVNLLQCLAETIFFYHPAAWWISARIRAERENCCDDLALSLGYEPVGYAQSLLQLATLAATRCCPVRPVAGLSATGNPTQLRRRIARLLKVSEPPQHVARTWLMASVLLVGLAILGVVSCGNARSSNNSQSSATAHTLHPLVRDMLASPVGSTQREVFFNALRQLAQAQGKDPRDYLTARNRMFKTDFIDGRAVELDGLNKRYVLVILTTPPSVSPGVAGQQLILLNRDGTILDRLQCYIASKYRREVQTQIPVDSQGDGAHIVVHLGPRRATPSPGTALDESPAWHVIVLGQEVHELGAVSGQEREQGLCRIAIAHNRFVVLFPSLAQGSWGTPDKGVALRLRSAKMQWPAEESPTVLADFRNENETGQMTGLVENRELEVDGRWYVWTAPARKYRPTLKAGQVGAEMAWQVGLGWKAKDDRGQALQLLPGRHTLRFTVDLVSEDEATNPSRHLISGPLVLEVLPASLGVVPRNVLREIPRPAEQPADLVATTYGEWSKSVNGLQARLILKRSEVNNGTGIITAYLELRNVADVGNPMKLSWASDKMAFHVVDDHGRKLPWPDAMSYNRRAFGQHDLTLPYDSTLLFDISTRGAGIPGEQAALVDLGPTQTFVIPHDGKDYYLRATLELPQRKPDRDGFAWLWHGKLELPPARIPVNGVALAPTRADELVRELGNQMLNKNAAGEKARRLFSLIDDPRVVPWYVKAVSSDSYDLKFAALGRLSRFPGDEALQGLKIGMGTRGSDIGNCTTDAVASQCADGIRHSAALALARSPHPKAKDLLWTMKNDTSAAVRITVIQTAGNLSSLQSLELLKQMSRDGDEGIRNEALRYLQLRAAATQPDKHAPADRWEAIAGQRVALEGQMVRDKTGIVYLIPPGDAVRIELRGPMQEVRGGQFTPVRVSGTLELEKHTHTTTQAEVDAYRRALADDKKQMQYRNLTVGQTVEYRRFYIREPVVLELSPSVGKESKNMEDHSVSDAERKVLLDQIDAWAKGNAWDQGGGRLAKGLQRSQLAVKVTAPQAAVVRAVAPRKYPDENREVLVLPLEIANRSGTAVKTSLAHEWHGGIWPPTDLYVAAILPKQDSRAADRPVFMPVYLAGEKQELTLPTILVSGESTSVIARMDWPGTGSVYTSRLVERPGIYKMIFVLVVDAGGKKELAQKQYVLSEPVVFEHRPGSSAALATQPADAVAWGKAVQGGVKLAKLGVRWTDARDNYRAGDELAYTLLVCNTDREPVMLADYAPLVGWAPNIRDAAGKRVEVNQPSIDIPAAQRRRTAKPGEVLEVGTLRIRLDTSTQAASPPNDPTPHLHLPPGTYRLSQTYRFVSDAKFDPSTWSGELTTGELVFTVADPTETQKGPPGTGPAPDPRRFPDAVVFINDPRLGRDNGSACALSLNGAATSNHFGVVSEVSWTWLRQVQGGDLYRFSRKSLGDSAKPRTAETQVMYAGKEVVVWEDVIQRVILKPQPTPAAEANRAATPQRAGDDPVAMIRAVLPENWAILKVVDNTYPSYRPEGRGKAIYLVKQPHTGRKQAEDAIVYIMPVDYSDGGSDPTHGQAQTYPAKLVATTPKAKIYVWGIHAGWSTLKEDILRVFVEAPDTMPAATQPSAATRQAVQWENGPWSSDQPLQTRLGVQGKTFAAGGPIPMRLEVRNVGTQPILYYHATGYEYGQIQVTGPDGQPLPFLVGPVSSTSAGVNLPPGAEQKVDQFDLTDHYHMRKPGQYTVHFRGFGTGHKREVDFLTFLPPSPTVQVTVTADPQSEADGDPVGKLLADLPEGWSMWGSSKLDVNPVYPGQGWSQVPGSFKRIYHHSYSPKGPRGQPVGPTPITLWLTTEQAKVEPWTDNQLDADHPQRALTRYLGGNRFYHVYAYVPDSSLKLWPAVETDLRRILRIANTTTQPGWKTTAP